jgi:hypothetical protein
MDKQVKEILIDMVKYYEGIKNTPDSLNSTLQQLATRAEAALRVEHTRTRQKPYGVDPFAMDVCGEVQPKTHKRENDW